MEQSVFHLRLAKAEWLLRRGRRPAAAVRFIASSVDLLASLQGRRFDLVHSSGTLQYMAPPLQSAYLEQLCDALAPGGALFVEVRGERYEVRGKR